MARFDLSSKSFNTTTTHLNFPRAFEDHPDSGVCSPPLWRTRTTTSPPPNHRHDDDDYESLSPPGVSKAQVIARGQRELMDMVSKMPESCYELSLKDLVEVVNTETEEEDKDGKVVFDELPQRIQKRPSKVVRKTKSDRWVDPIRNGDVNNSGFLLKLVFPVSLGSKKKTKKKDDDDDDDSSVTSKGSRFFTRPEDKDWWKNGLSESRRSTQTGLVSRINSGSSKSSGTGSSSRSNSLRDENRGCLSCLWNVHQRDL
ncbi:PREDICTED: uncharacterized protein LOC104751593 isoform X1 [Camelina sativa]|uniref:Uncharacterized protein LOC104751593 isoform X1 n=1 Tax=Camelina sativa TaxID=90675 RepID=A0ABM0WJ92_CAMSA|nr:PREDICTED: uncharacterized protein LOC104751593 isoform X2 [Camelina sativa]XP_010471864.1 PREDICTED: uncharacterized protein LOC104751593 isoform X1 [Camelina sativa]